LQLIRGLYLVVRKLISSCNFSKEALTQTPTRTHVKMSTLQKKNSTKCLAGFIMQDQQKQIWKDTSSLQDDLIHWQVHLFACLFKRFTDNSGA